MAENVYLAYTPSVEELIKSKGEQCEVLSKLHLMSHEKYKAVELYFNIPIITITAIVGFISALNIQFEHINIIIGSLSLFVSLFKSYLAYLKFSQKNENHRVAYLQYFQISNEMRIELSLEPSLRQQPAYFLNLIKIKMKNLNEVSEIIPKDIISRYKRFYHNKEMVEPDVIMGMHPICIYRSIEEDENKKLNRRYQCDTDDDGVSRVNEPLQDEMQQQQEQEQEQKQQDQDKVQENTSACVVIEM
jgi:hypothetical protein